MVVAGMTVVLALVQANPSTAEGGVYYTRPHVKNVYLKVSLELSTLESRLGAEEREWVSI